MVVRHVSFTAMTDGSVEDWGIISEETKRYEQGLANRVLAHLDELHGEHGGFCYRSF